MISFISYLLKPCNPAQSVPAMARLAATKLVNFWFIVTIVEGFIANKTKMNKSQIYAWCLCVIYL